MLRQIRRGTFETNSSSTHAICITKKEIYKDLLPKHLTFYHDEFGWENAEYSTLRKRASYLYQAICDCYDKEEKIDKLNQITTILDHYHITCEFKANDGDYEDGYIDHAENLIDFIDKILKNEDAFMKYLFGNSFVITGNDNGYDFNERMRVRLDDEHTQYGIYPQYGELKEEFEDYDIYEKDN